MYQKGTIKLIDKSKGLVRFTTNNRYFPKSFDMVINNKEFIRLVFFGGGPTRCYYCLKEFNGVIDLQFGEQLTISLDEKHNLTACNMHKWFTGDRKKGTPWLASIEHVFCV